MNALRMIGFALLGLLLGGALGTGLGLVGGLGWTTLASTSSFEGYSGFVVAFWMLGGLVLGAVAGLVMALRWAGRRKQESDVQP